MAATELGVTGARFTLNGTPVYLHGISYYGALGAPEDSIRRDLGDMRRLGLNWIRVWATWYAFDFDVSAVDGEGNPRQPYLKKLQWLVAECDRRGMVVDVTLSRGNGGVGPPRLQTHEAHLRAVRTVCTALARYRNWYLDLSNERNIRDQRHTSIEELARLREAVAALNPRRLVTASHAGDLSRGDLEQYLRTVKVDFVAVHRPRDADSPGQTEAWARQYLEWMRELGRVVPVHFQEPFRRGYGEWEPRADDFVTDALGAKAGGAAGWCLHNGDQRNGPDRHPRRSFDLRARRLFDQLDPEEMAALERLAIVFPPAGAFTPRTRVSIRRGRWHLNGAVTYPGSRAEGLLMNVRMVNAVFEDRARSGFDPEANTDRFLVWLPDYVAHGVRAFTVCLQGGFPGYEGALNSAFNADGSLREEYLARVRRVIEACDRLGACVIVGCFYQRQDQVLRDEAAVRAGVVNVARWVQRSGYTNVLLEIANEYPHDGFDHRLLRTPEGEAELVRLAKRTAPGILVSTSGIGDGRLDDAVARAADFLLIHFNGVPVSEIPARIAAVRSYGKPIVCNEDAKEGEEAARAAEASVANGASWGLMLEERNQHHPFTWSGAADDPVVYATLKKLTTPGR